MDLNIRVCLRVRPLTSREASSNGNLTLCLDSLNSTSVQLHNPILDEDVITSQYPRKFTFDYCFWSADRSFPHLSSQQTVFETIGAQVLDALFDGYNACVLAYGQSGTGKTYTMMGTEAEPGLTPRLCSALFERTSSMTISSARIQVSFMEIYNEKVRDLLDDGHSAQMRVREHPKFGPYVQDLSRHGVENAASALDLLSVGLLRRTCAATHSNGHSSRSHAVFTIHCTTARMLEDGSPRETTAKLHLVDLAGSERANRDLVSRLRLKEGSLINKSLATLGNVINALAERSASANLNTPSSSTCSSTASSPRRRASTSKLPFVPYRDSVLTWILKDSLGGNSRTFVIAAVSPSVAAFKETLSTLRFAQRAKHIVNTPVVNEDSTVKLIRHLREEVSRLRSILAQSVIRPESLLDLMTANQSKAQELTEDWLQKWRPFEENNPVKSSDASVQTIADDSMMSSDDEEENQANWSDDSLEGIAHSREEESFKRVRARKTASKPHVKTIFVPATSPPKIVIDSPTRQEMNKEEPAPDGQALMTRLNTLISNLSINRNANNSTVPEKPLFCCRHHCVHHCCHHHHCHIQAQVNNKNSVTREELLMIRRRMVARTASKKVLDSLPYLTQWRESGYITHQPASQESNLLPGENWV